MPGEYYPPVHFCDVHGYGSYECSHNRFLPNFHPRKEDYSLKDYSFEPLADSTKKIRDQLLADPKFIEGIYEGVKAMKEGKVTPWEEVKKELDIE